MLVIVIIIICDVLGVSGLPKSSPMERSVSGKINCISPVSDNGIFPEEKENINKGVTDTMPASQISWFVPSGRLLGKIIGRLNSHTANAKHKLRKNVSKNNPLKAFKMVVFFMYV